MSLIIENPQVEDKIDYQAEQEKYYNSLTLGTIVRKWPDGGMSIDLIDSVTLRVVGEYSLSHKGKIHPIGDSPYHDKIKSLLSHCSPTEAIKVQTDPLTRVQKKSVSTIIQITTKKLF